jgi:hypothetical protein
VSEHAGGRADEVAASGLLGGEADDDGGGVDEGDAGGDRRPAAQGRALGRCKRKGLKSEKTRPKKRSMLLRLPNSSAVQVGGRHERLRCRLGFHGRTATAPKPV